MEMLFSIYYYFLLNCRKKVFASIFRWKSLWNCKIANKFRFSIFKSEWRTDVIWCWVDCWWYVNLKIEWFVEDNYDNIIFSIDGEHSHGFWKYMLVANIVYDIFQKYICFLLNQLKVFTLLLSVSWWQVWILQCFVIIVLIC